MAAVARKSQLHPARLKRLYSALQKTSDDAKHAALFSAALTASEKRDKLLFTFGSSAYKRFRRVPDLSVATGIAAATGRGTVVIALSENFSNHSPALAFAGRGKLPIIYVVWDDGVPKKWPTYERCCLPSIFVEATDTIALFRVMQEALLHARLGAGPTLIACQETLPQTPLQHMENYLRQKQLWRAHSSNRLIASK
ncbi:MAG: hypothetical protein NVS9B15_24290 [Acidobacteriaceae bacterium]